MGKLSFLLAILLVLASGAARADEAAETRLRDALRAAITQQRSLEDSQAQLQAKISEQEKQIAAMKAQLDQKKPAQVDQALIERVEAEANRRITAGNTALAQAGETAAKWKAAYEQAANVARAKESERLQAVGAMDGLKKRVKSCESKNDAMFKAANEVLDHLKAVSVAEAMEAHEPFVGTKRVEIQNLAQDDGDKLLDQKVGASPDMSMQAASEPAAEGSQ